MWLPADLAAQVKAARAGSGISLTDLVRRGLEAQRLEEAAARLERVVERLEALTA